MIATDWVTNGWLKRCLMHSRNFWLNEINLTNRIYEIKVILAYYLIKLIRINK